MSRTDDTLKILTPTSNARGISNIEQSTCRNFLIDLVETELVGPRTPDEIITENPQQRYVVGQLASSAETPDEDASAFDDVEPVDENDTFSGVEGRDEVLEAVSDSGITRARSESLTSIGISFVLEAGARIIVDATWGEYARAGDDTSARYCRTQRAEIFELKFDGPTELDGHSFGRAKLNWVARQTGRYLIASVFLVNATRELPKDGTGRLYQVGFELRGADGARPFLSRDRVIRSERPTMDDLLYRSRLEYGVGLHTAVIAGDVDSAVGAAGILATTVMPRAETDVTTSRAFENPETLSMERLACSSSRAEIAQTLRGAFAMYGTWADEIDVAISQLPEVFRPLGKRQLVDIRKRLERLRHGINIIEENERVFVAFQFANEVMARARFRQEHPKTHLGEAWEASMSGVWHPFQLAFLISQISETADPTDPNRDVVDVLFFPTGGGKTEAYLGLAAFTMAWRRIETGVPYRGAGSSILMRYTLRLLTAQQFSRAASLMAAAELMRVRNWREGALGYAPFAIGLWVGPMTPNRYEDAVDSLKEARRAHDSCERNCSLSVAEKEISRRGTSQDSDKNFMVLTECPWCADPLCVDCVLSHVKPNRIEITCGNSGCPLSATGSIGRIPIWFVDSDIYRECPTLLVATVDKFATLPYRGEAKALFGNVQGYCESCGFFADTLEHGKACMGSVHKEGRARTFDLIIQDELHTINDNIGSVYGIYESVIEYLIDLSGLRPKYIAATATVKDVDRQVRQLYGGRSAAVFPPSGLDAGDTFFSTAVEPTLAKPGRKYVGIYAPTKSRLTAFVSALSSVLAAAWEAKERFGVTAADPYLTMLGYFNTVRDLGGVKSLLADDVPPAMERIAKENGWEVRDLHNWEDELTGRIDSGEVPQRLALLAKRFDAGSLGCDFMACTNMISVGVDVPRLGLMVVDGQPKSTSEYIQATSRIGRSSEGGVVFVVYNAMRPRDVSHYEHFHAYHRSYYRFVEAGSVTPFSDGCINRYMAGAFVAGYRLGDSDSSNASADRFKLDASGMGGELEQFIVERARRFGNHELASATSTIDTIVTEWSMTAEPLQYARPSLPPVARKATVQKGGPRPVITPPEDRGTDLKRDEHEQALFVAPRSMRSVEATVPLKVANYGE